MPDIIPIHEFKTDDPGAVPFRFIPLNAGSGYDIFQPHRHNYYEIFFFSTGGGTHTIDFNEVPIESHSVHFISPGQVHLMKRSPESKGHIILFSREFYHCQGNSGNDLFAFPFLHNNTLIPVLQLDADSFQTFSLFLLQIREEQDNHNSEVLRAYLELILRKCKSLFTDATPQVHSKDQELFTRFRLLVENEYRTNRQPSSYASALFITEKKLNQVCKSETGLSVGDFIRDRVLLEAKRLLHNADYTVKEIGYFLGFEDPSYFNRFFKTNTGLTAVEFRNRQLAL